MKRISIVSIVLLSVLFLFFTSCDKNKCSDSPDVSNIPMEVKIERVEQKLFKEKTFENINQVFSNDPLLSNLYFLNKTYPSNDVFVKNYLQMISHPAMDTIYQQVQSTFGNMKDVEEEFKIAFQHIKHYYPQFKAPKIKTIISGYSGMEMMITDTLIVLSLEYFLGPNSRYAPNLPSYILKRFQKQYMVPMVTLLLSGNYNKVNSKDKTLLSEMIHYGKAYYFAKTMLPCMNDTLFTGYTKQEAIDVKYFEDVIWANFVQNKLLYKTDQFVISRFVGESPSTPEIGDKCPGRIGRWIGLQIVENYMKNNPSVTLTQLMNLEDVQGIFEGAKYHPKKKSKKE